MTTEQFAERAELITAQETLTEPFGWYWLSFAGPDKCNGVVILQCNGVAPTSPVQQPVA